MPRPCQRIDSHHHLWDLAVRDQAWTVPFPVLHRSFTMSDLRPGLEAESIDGTVLVQSLALAQETPELLDIARTDPHIVGVVGWVDLTAPDVGDRLAELADPLLVGIRHLVQDESDPDWLMRPRVRRGIAAVAAAGLAYDLLIRPAQLPAAIELVNSLPDVSFVLDHGGKPPIASGLTEPWKQHLTALAARQNVAVKLSGLVTEAGHDFVSGTFLPYSPTSSRLLRAIAGHVRIGLAGVPAGSLLFRSSRPRRIPDPGPISRRTKPSVRRDIDGLVRIGIAARRHGPPDRRAAAAVAPGLWPR